MRIRFKSNVSRIEFFSLYQKRANKQWSEIRNDLRVLKGTFDRYKSGTMSMPAYLFDKMLATIDEESRDKFLLLVERLPDNFGQVIGGKKAYRINYEKFKEGRVKGILAMKRGRREMAFEFSSLQLSSQLCEFIGAFIGDGFFNCYKNKLYHIEFAGDSRKDLDYYKEIIIPAIKTVIPEIHPRIQKVKSKNSIRIIFYSKKLFCLLKDAFGFIPGKKAYTVNIPNKIISEKEEFVRATIRGVFDTDGGVYLDKRKAYESFYPRIIFSTVSKALYNQVSAYLSKYFKLYSTIREAKGNRGQIYIIEIYGRKQLFKWMSLIGFSNKRHLEKVALVAK